MTDIDKLRADFEKAEQAVFKLQAEKDDALQKISDRFSDRQREANQKAADAQKALNDALAAQALRKRYDEAREAESSAKDAGDVEAADQHLSEAVAVQNLADTLKLQLPAAE